jgi:hypothetical protein
MRMIVIAPMVPNTTVTTSNIDREAKNAAIFEPPFGFDAGPIKFKVKASDDQR